MRARFLVFLAVGALLACILPGGVSFATDKLPAKADKSCLKCHKYDKQSNLFAGRVANVSKKAKTIQVRVGPDVEVVYFDDKTEVKNAPAVKNVKKNQAVRIDYIRKDGKNYAKLVEVKKGMDVPKDKLMTVEEVAKLVALGPEKGKYTLFDSRPAGKYNQGHIPTAELFPFFAFEKLKDKKLPKDKERLLIFYCEGLACVLSPLSAKKAEKLGYKNVKVFHAGNPAWDKAGYPLVSNVDYLKYLNSIDMSYILIDLRPEKLMEKGHIPGAVAAPNGNVAALKDQFPKYKKAIIILYNQDGDVAKAKEAYKTISGWGYGQTSILRGGFKAWEDPKRKVASGPPAKKIHYVKKLLPGEIEFVDFKKLVEKPRGDAIIIDTRTVDEYHACGLPYSFNIPLEILESRIPELPRDKTLVLHCSSGVRSQMGYNILKKAGFDAKYLNTTIKFDRVDPAKCTIKEEG